MKRCGSAYLELVLSVVIFAAYIVPIYSWIVRAGAAQSRLEQSYIARNAIESALANYRATPSAQRQTGSFQSGVSALPGGTLTSVVTELDANHPSLLQYSLTLTWQGDGGTKILQAGTFINNGGG